MREALCLAHEAAARSEVPVGAIVVVEGKIVARASNMCEATHDPTAHAEILAIRQASETLQSRRLPRSTLYVTLEPCIMCAGAILQSRIERVVFGCRDPKGGAVRSSFALLEDPRLNHRVQVIEGVLAQESASCLQEFFASLRTEKAQRSPQDT